MPSVSIGVISDTHGLIRPEAIAALKGSDLIVHAGDIGGQHVLDALAQLAPVRAVYGNVDEGRWAHGLPATRTLTIEGHCLHVLHRLEDLDPTAQPAAAVIAGHSHAPHIETRNGVLYFNPGSAGPRRFRLPVAVGRLTVDGNGVRGEVLTLDV
jgi:putative phosphoesterase